MNKIDNHAYAKYLTKKGPNAQGAIWSSVMLSSSHMEKCYHFEKQKLLPMPLAKESYAKKIRMTPWIKNCVWELSNLTWAYIVINVLKLVIEPT